MIKVKYIQLTKGSQELHVGDDLIVAIEAFLNSTKDGNCPIDVSQQIVDTFNECQSNHGLCKYNLKAKSKQLRKLISARMQEGYSIEEIKQVIVNSYDHWVGTEFEKYLRPVTLLKEDKFDYRLNLKPKKKQVKYTGFN